MLDLLSLSSPLLVALCEMGLLKIIRKVKRREKEMRLLMLGLDNAGKTTILMRFIDEPIEGIPPTVGFNIKTVADYSPNDVLSRKLEGSDPTDSIPKYKLNIWDVGGQRSIRTFWRNYFEQTDGLIWVVDSADVFRLDDCKAELFSLLKEERLAGASLLIFANKQDIPGVASVSEIADILELSKIQETGRHCAIFACSAYESKDSIERGIAWIVGDIGKRVYVLQ